MTAIDVASTWALGRRNSQPAALADCFCTRPDFFPRNHNCGLGVPWPGLTANQDQPTVAALRADMADLSRDGAPMGASATGMNAIRFIAPDGPQAAQTDRGLL